MRYTNPRTHSLTYSYFHLLGGANAAKILRQKFVLIFIFGFVTPKGMYVGHNGSSSVLSMSVPAVVHEKSCGNKKCDEEEEERQNFGLFATL